MNMKYIKNISSQLIIYCILMLFISCSNVKDVDIKGQIMINEAALTKAINEDAGLYENETKIYASSFLALYEVYEIDKEDLMKLRIGIAENPDTFKKLYSESSFVNMYGELQGQKNKIIAKELKEAAEKEPLIYNKQWYFYTQFEPETILRDDIDEVILGCYNVGKPIQLYFNDLIK